MATLSQAKKDGIMNNVLTETFKPRRLAYKEEKFNFLDRLYRFYVSEENEEICKKFPSGFLCKTVTFNYTIGREHFREALRAERYVPYIAAERWGGYDVTDVHMTKEHYRIAEIYKGINRDEGLLRNKMAELLAGVKTTKQLEGAWPEGKAFYTEFLDRPAPLVPMVVPKELNLLISAYRG